MFVIFFYVDDDVIWVIHLEALQISGAHQVHDELSIWTPNNIHDNSGSVLKSLKSHKFVEILGTFEWRRVNEGSPDMQHYWSYLPCNMIDSITCIDCTWSWYICLFR